MTMDDAVVGLPTDASLDASEAGRASHRAPKGVKPPRSSRKERKAKDEAQATSGRHRRLMPNRPFWQELPILIIVALLAAYLMKTFVFQVFFIPSGSMENTLLINDRVLVDKVSYGFRDIKRGEVIVFNAQGVLSPENSEPLPASNLIDGAIRGVQNVFGLAQNSETDYIKRLIGLPGDRVACCDAQGRMTINGVPLDEKSYLYPGDASSLTPFDVLVPDKKLWVMGDHRSASADSRSRIGTPGGGFVPQDRVVGRAFVVTFPFNSLSRLPIPETFKQPAIEAQKGKS